MAILSASSNDAIIPAFLVRENIALIYPGAGVPPSHGKDTLSRYTPVIRVRLVNASGVPIS